MVPDFATRRLDEMCRWPRLWGSAEAFELVALTLLEVERGEDGSREGRTRVVDAWCRFRGSSHAMSTIWGDPVEVAIMVSRFRREVD